MSRSPHKFILKVSVVTGNVLFCLCATFPPRRLCGSSFILQEEKEKIKEEEELQLCLNFLPEGDDKPSGAETSSCGGNCHRPAANSSSSSTGLRSLGELTAFRPAFRAAWSRRRKRDTPRPAAVVAAAAAAAAASCVRVAVRGWRDCLRVIHQWNATLAFMFMSVHPVFIFQNKRVDGVFRSTWRVVLSRQWSSNKVCFVFAFHSHFPCFNIFKMLCFWLYNDMLLFYVGAPGP